MAGATPTSVFSEALCTGRPGMFPHPPREKLGKPQRFLNAWIGIIMATVWEGILLFLVYIICRWFPTLRGQSVIFLASSSCRSHQRDHAALRTRSSAYVALAPTSQEQLVKLLGQRSASIARCPRVLLAPFRRRSYLPFSDNMRL